MSLQHGVFIIFLLASLLGCTSLQTAGDGQNAAPSEKEVAQINLKLGVGYMQSKNFDVAAEKLHKALEYDSNLVEAENALGVLYEATDANLLAEKHYKNALALNGQFLLAQMNFGRFLCATGRTEQGEAFFLQAAQSPQQESPEIAYTGAGVCARRGNRLAQAEAHFEQALQENGSAAAALYELAIIKNDQRDYQAAKGYLDTYHDRAGFSQSSLQLATAVEKALGNRAKSEQYAAMLRQSSR